MIAESFERIHRSNLIGMGILPLEFKRGESRTSLEFTGEEAFDIMGVAKGLKPGEKLDVLTSGKGPEKSFTVTCRIDTPAELAYYEHGGILQYVLRSLL